MKVMPAEWEKQSLVLLSFPHKNTDWYQRGDIKQLTKALSVFVKIAQAIAYSQPVYIICKDRYEISDLFCSTNNMTFIELPFNDTWIRDYGYISLHDNSSIRLLNFTFDGWGGKFEASLDNNINRLLHKKGYMGSRTLEEIDFVLEGGSIESDGNGTIMTTTSCLCNSNRNSGLTKVQIEKHLYDYLGAKRVLWLDHGYLAGDDTDSHIDTLARFVNSHTIVYVKCVDKEDEHYLSLFEMEKELKKFKTKDNKLYSLIPLPMCKAQYDSLGDRLPATYANFLITNKALIYPTYDDPNDKKVGDILKELFADREMIPINCLRLVEQGGSLHCSTMQVH